MKKKYKTKFPVARIKKIMQMDEDVGKVAQATPVLISKALELFMQSLIDKACNEARSRNGKRLSVAHLKRTIETTEQFDFLKDVVADIPDPGEGPPLSGGGHTGGNEEASSSTTTTSRPNSRRAKHEGQIVFESGTGTGRGRRGRGRGRGGAARAPVSDVRGRGKRKVKEEEEEDREEEDEEEDMDTD